MNTEDFSQLEKLLDKLRGHLGHRFCIVTNVIGEQYHLALYDTYGEPVVKVIGGTVELAASRALEQLEQTTK